ncbi:MAG: hypothetical protein EOO47_11670 [Flavobacterium sp.]|nr:MAG: hypothetical protein EOO47_11670 [Flavobacterium sp.]
MKGLFNILLFAFIYGGYLLLTNFLFGNDNLITAKGKPSFRNIVIRKEAVKKTDDSIQVALFTFRLMGNNKFFNLKMNIENMHQGFNVFGGVNKTLSEAGEVTVSIRKGEAHENIPKVYKIVADEETIYEIKKKPSDNAKTFLTLLFISFAGFVFYLLINRPTI